MSKADSIQVFGTDYEVRLVRPAGDSWGEINHEEQTIYISPHTARDVRSQTLWHELIHAIEFHAGLDLGEQAVDILAAGVYAILKANPHMIHFRDEIPASNSASDAPVLP